MADLAARLSNLSVDQRALLQSRLQAARAGQASTAGTSAAITRLTRDRDVFPLSFAQERLWFLDQLQPYSAAYNIPEVYSFSGPLNVEALERALQEILRRHEVLRSRFVVREGQPAQCIDPPPAPVLRMVDLRPLAADARPAALQRLVMEAAGTVFDLSAGLLLRATLVALGDADHVLLVTMHHIVSDGWSMAIFARELTQLYQAYYAGQPSPLAELPIQYVDFAHWQRHWLSGAVLQRLLDYWRGQLAGAPAILALPTDRPRPPMQTFVGAQYNFNVAPEVTAALTALARQEGATLFMVLLATFKALLYRWSGQEDIVVGTLTAGRNRVDIEGLIGFFVNTLALRTDLSGNPRFRDLVRRVRTVTLEGFAHQDLPFEKLVGELRPERRLSQHPLFQVLFALQNISAQTAAPPQGASPPPAADPAPVAARTAKFDVALFMSPSGAGLAASFEYNVDLFDAATIARMAAHLVTLLDGVVATPDRPILDIPLEAAVPSAAGREHRRGRLEETFDFELTPSS
ncbi:MAG: condensation domain-containing protein [Azospirillaceae bacterium]|nr:condensation domain-containing protein [Azospirillaceae bacterium]